MNRKYYDLCGKVLVKAAWAFSEKKNTLYESELISYIIENNSIGCPLYLNIYTRKLERILITRDNMSEVKNLWTDIQPNNFAYPLMSSRMKELIAANLTGEEGLTWVPVDVIGPDETRIYYIPRFTKELDVLNEEKTKYDIWEDGTKTVFNPCFSRKKIQKYTMFYKPCTFWQVTYNLHVNEDIKKAIQKAKLTGVGFEEARVE